MARALSGEGLNSQAAACCQPDVMAGHSGGALGRKSGGRAQRWPQLGSRSLTAPPLPQAPYLQSKGVVGIRNSHTTQQESPTHLIVFRIYVGLAIFKNYLFKHKASSTKYTF